MESFSNWFDKIYVENAPKMIRVAYHLLGDEKTAEDIVQNTFIVLLVKPEVRTYDNIQAWLYVTLKNQIGNEMQRRRHRKFLPLDEWRERESECDSPDHFALADCLPKGLTDKEKEILIYIYQDELTYEEIAKKMEKSVLACRTRLYRAKAHCKELLKKLKN